MGTLSQENTALKRTNKKVVREGEPSGNKHIESWHVPTNTAADEERCKIHLELWELGDKYMDMAKQMGMPSTMDQLLISTDLLYRAGVMVIPLPPMFKVSHMEVYDRSKDPLEQLKTFKVHMTLNSFLGKIAY